MSRPRKNTVKTGESGRSTIKFDGDTETKAAVLRTVHKQTRSGLYALLVENEWQRRFGNGKRVAA